MAEEYVNLLTSPAVIKAVTPQEIQQATTEDAMLQMFTALNMNPRVAQSG